MSLSYLRALVAATVLIVAAAPFVSSGAHGDSCEQAWRATTGVRDCGFAFTGFPITAYGNACRTTTCQSGAASVHVWVTVSTTSVVVLECSAEGVGFASCDNELSPGTALSTLAGSVPLTCNVSGTGGGVFGCGSGCVYPGQGPACEILATPLPTPG